FLLIQHGSEFTEEISHVFSPKLLSHRRAKQRGRQPQYSRVLLGSPAPMRGSDPVAETSPSASPGPPTLHPTAAHRITKPAPPHGPVSSPGTSVRGGRTSVTLCTRAYRGPRCSSPKSSATAASWPVASTSTVPPGM